MWRFVFAVTETRKTNARRTGVSPHRRFGRRPDSSSPEVIVGLRIQQLRRKKGFTQDEFAERLASTEPTSIDWKIVADALGVKIRDLVKGV
jgi:DNA-binding transcriptional regulator YiaG